MSRKLYTLCFVRNQKNILLGMKKKGFGKGRWNGFGGKVEEGERLEAAARREVKEEAGIEVGALEERGVLEFVFTKEPEHALEVHVFCAFEWSGEPSESEEMRPQWFMLDEIPFKEMWADDPYWFPLLLSEKHFRGKFLFDDNDAVLEHRVEEVL